MSTNTYFTFGLNLLAVPMIASGAFAVMPTAGISAIPVISRPDAADVDGVFRRALADPILCTPACNFLSDFCNPNYVKDYDNW
jgi:hypothetical protein